LVGLSRTWTGDLTLIRGAL